MVYDLGMSPTVHSVYGAVIVKSYRYSHKRLKKVRIVLYGNPFQRYRVSLAIWDHTVFPATRHK